jgi:hypothetical protein
MTLRTFSVEIDRQCTSPSSRVQRSIRANIPSMRS